MKTVEINGQLRDNTGKKETKQLRDKGLVPAVIYGGKEPLHFAIDERDVNKIVFSPELYAVQVTADGKTFRGTIKEMQFHPVTDRVTHLDFIELDDTKKVNVDVPVKLLGNAIGVRNGGKLKVGRRYLKIVALPGDIPESLEVDIAKLRIGKSIRITDLSFSGIEFTENPSTLVCQVKRARGSVNEEEEGEGAETTEAVEAAAAE